MTVKTVSIRAVNFRPNDQMLVNGKWRTITNVRLGHRKEWVRVTYAIGNTKSETLALQRTETRDLRLSDNPGKQDYSWVTIRYANGEEGLGYIVENNDGVKAKFTDLKWAAAMFQTLTGIRHNGDLPVREPQNTNP